MPFVLPETQAVLDILNAAPGPKLHQMQPAEMRAGLGAIAHMFDAPRPPLAAVEDSTIAGRPVRTYTPEGAQAGQRIVFYHGGGFCAGDIASHDGLCGRIAAESGMAVTSVDYRLAPEDPFPAAFDDCLAVTLALADAPGGLVLAGDSAGGNLTAGISIAMREARPGVVKAQLLLYPAVDVTGAAYASETAFANGYMLEQEGIAHFMACYLPPSVNRQDPRVSPLLAASHAGLPPAVIATCTLDPLLDQGRTYAAKLIQSGVDVRYHELQGHIHGCFNMRKAIPSADAALLRLLADLKTVLA